MVKCVYCKSNNTRSEKKSSRALSFEIFFEPLVIESKVQKSIQIDCQKCGRNYENLHLKDMVWTSTLYRSQNFLEQFASIYPQVDIDEYEDLQRFMKYITKFSKDNYQIIIEIEKKKSIVDCNKYGRSMVALSIEEMKI